jgi:carbamoylphosphate synthase small subunit
MLGWYVKLQIAWGLTLLTLVVQKYNQIRCFVNRGVELKVVPWDYDILNEEDYDGLFVRYDRI